jgi:anti-sigma factor (TIGR02949 family)
MDHPDESPMTCRELFERLSEYLDGELSPELCAEIRRHMDGCDPCINFAKTLKATADLCRRLPAHRVPPEVAADLRAFLTARQPRSFTKSP